MPHSTRYLARIIGLFAILIVAVLLIRGTDALETVVSDPSVMQVYALISLGLGIAMVVGHNVWARGTLPTVVTVVGWLILAKGLVLLLATPEQVLDWLERLHYWKYEYFYLSPAFLIGLYLTWAGFRTPSQPLPKSTDKIL